MNFLKLFIFFTTFSIILNSCSTFREANKVLRNEKSRTTDEFLIKKKEPLTQPPDFDKIPEPGSIKTSSETNQNRIEKILKSSRSESENNQVTSSSTEDSILNKIKK